ncbi:MAG TPA: AmpG family muropeptide MFS transporter [Polyangiaceae bacterium]|nr:AmpG family muropeptide MFS transporter [Polyangiaceae bacterium]
MLDGSTVVGFRQLLWNRRMLLCLALGFSSGLPLYVTMTLLQAWLHREGVSLRDIGLFNLTGLPYTWKFIWAPLLDRYPLPFLGRRRGWGLVTQLALVASIAGLGWLDPKGSPASVAVLAVLVAFFSATQDIVLNAYQREILPDRELGLGTAMHVNAYRLAALVPGSLALVLADHLPWSLVYATVAAFMLVGILASLFGPEGVYPAPPPATLEEAIVGPFREFFARQDRVAAVLVLLFMLLYKFGDSLAAALVTPFYLQVGFTLTEVGVVVKGAGAPATIVGLFLGGFIISRIGINRALWVFGVGQLVSTLGFALLARLGPDVGALAGVVGFEYLASGLGTAAFGAFIARSTDQRFTATQFALFSSLIALPRTAASAATGFLVEAIGYGPFFVVCAALGIPGMTLLIKVAPWSATPAVPPSAAPVGID